MSCFPALPRVFIGGGRLSSNKLIGNDTVDPKLKVNTDENGYDIFIGIIFQAIGEIVVPMVRKGVVRNHRHPPGSAIAR